MAAPPKCSVSGAVVYVHAFLPLYVRVEMAVLCSKITSFKYYYHTLEFCSWNVKPIPRGWLLLLGMLYTRRVFRWRFAFGFELYCSPVRCRSANHSQPPALRCAFTLCLDVVKLRKIFPQAPSMQKQLIMELCCNGEQDTIRIGFGGNP